MRITRHRRISGRARLAYHRDRELRRQAGQSVAEYLHPDQPDRAGEHRIAIVHGSPRLARFDVLPVEPVMDADWRIDLACSTAVLDEGRGDSAAPLAGWDWKDVGDGPNAAEEDAAVPAVSDASPPEPVLVTRVTQNRGSRVDLCPTSRVRPAQHRIGDVFVGCAAGGVAAAIILVLVKTFVG